MASHANNPAIKVFALTTSITLACSLTACKEHPKLRQKAAQLDASIQKVVVEGYPLWEDPEEDAKEQQASPHSDKPYYCYKSWSGVDCYTKPLEGAKYRMTGSYEPPSDLPPPPYLEVQDIDTRQHTVTDQGAPITTPLTASETNIQTQNVTITAAPTASIPMARGRPAHLVKEKPAPKPEQPTPASQAATTPTPQAKGTSNTTTNQQSTRRKNNNR